MYAQDTRLLDEHTRRLEAEFTITLEDHKDMNLEKGEERELSSIATNTFNIKNLTKTHELEEEWTAKELTCSLEEKPFLYLGLETKENGPKQCKPTLDVRTSI
jgi:hypothetical protein